MGIVTDFLRSTIVGQVDEHRLIVWFDPDAHYRDVVRGLELPETAVVRYDSSFFLRSAVQSKHWWLATSRCSGPRILSGNGLVSLTLMHPLQLLPAEIAESRRSYGKRHLAVQRTCEYASRAACAMHSN